MVVCAFACTTSGFVTPIRSVKHCIDIEELTAEECQRKCRTENLNLETNRQTKDKLESELKNGNCCCKFDDFWPIKEENDWKRWKKVRFEPAHFGDKLIVEKERCIPLLFASSRSVSVQNYKTMCKYMAKTRPLTILELYKYIKSVAYLRFNEKRNPMIVRMQVSLGNTPYFTDHSQELFEQHMNLLFDHKRDENKPTELPFEIDQIQNLQHLATHLRDEFKSKVVSRALDELVISRVMISVIDAEKTIDSMLEPDTFEALHSNDGNSVDAAQVPMGDLRVSCKKFLQVRDALANLLNRSELALESLKTQPAFEEMSIGWRPMIKLQKSISVYDKLIQARCRNDETNSSNSTL